MSDLKTLFTKKTNDCITHNGKVIGWHPFAINIPTPTKQQLEAKYITEEDLKNE